MALLLDMEGARAVSLSRNACIWDALLLDFHGYLIQVACLTTKFGVYRLYMYDVVANV